MFKKIKFLLLISLLSISAVSIKTDAMSVYFEKNIQDVKVGDTFIVNVYLDTEGVEVNGIDGIIKIMGNIEVLNMSVAGSVFDLWPNRPSINNQEIEFVGGTPSNVFGKKNKIFSFAARAKDMGKVDLSLRQADVFLGDGSGKNISALGKSQSFDIKNTDNNIKNELADIILNDKNQPKPFNIELGQDYYLYDGKYFISFNTTDDESGINRYEVRENNLPAVRATNSYVLLDQSLKGFVEVKAIDNSGNIRTEILNLNKMNNGFMNKILGVSLIILIVIILLLIYKYFRFKIYTNKKKK